MFVKEKGLYAVLMYSNRCRNTKYDLQKFLSCTQKKETYTFAYLNKKHFDFIFKNTFHIILDVWSLDLP